MGHRDCDSKGAKMRYFTRQTTCMIAESIQKQMQFWISFELTHPRHQEADSQVYSFGNELAQFIEFRREANLSHKEQKPVYRNVLLWDQYTTAASFCRKSTEPDWMVLPKKIANSSAANLSTTGALRRFLSHPGASLLEMAVSFLFSTMSFSMCSQNWSFSQQGTSGNRRAVVLFVSMMTCLH